LAFIASGRKGTKHKVVYTKLLLMWLFSKLNLWGEASLDQVWTIHFISNVPRGTINFRVTRFKSKPHSMNIRSAIIVAIFVSITALSHAQPKWSAGYRTGLELVNFQITTQDFARENTIWHNQLFLTRRLGNKFALEAALFNTNKKYFNTGHSNLTDVDSIVNSVKQTKLGLNVAAKYHFFIRPKWSLYGQLGFTFVRTSDQYSNTAYKQREVQRSYNETENNVILFDRTFGGLGLDFNLSKRLFLTSTLNVYYKIDGITYPGNAYYNKWAANFLVGAGLKI
jgi:hypothetical protein